MWNKIFSQNNIFHKIMRSHTKLCEIYFIPLWCLYASVSLTLGRNNYFSIFWETFPWIRQYQAILYGESNRTNLHLTEWMSLFFFWMLISCKRAETAGHMLPLNTNRKSCMESQIVLLHLTLGDLKRSKSWSVRLWRLIYLVKEPNYTVAVWLYVTIKCW